MSMKPEDSDVPPIDSLGEPPVAAPKPRRRKAASPAIVQAAADAATQVSSAAQGPSATG